MAETTIKEIREEMVEWIKEQRQYKKALLKKERGASKIEKLQKAKPTYRWSHQVWRYSKDLEMRIRNVESPHTELRMRFNKDSFVAADKAELDRRLSELVWNITPQEIADACKQKRIFEEEAFVLLSMISSGSATWCIDNLFPSSGMKQNIRDKTVKLFKSAFL
jgi:hypothetical protein